MKDIIQIALVDDHRLFRSGMASLIGGFNGYRILFEAGNGEELIAKLKPRVKPHIILLDINMPVMDGMNTARWLRANHPDIHIIILSMFGDAENVLKMVKMGVKGYLLKDAEPDEFEQALHKVSHDEVYYPEFVNRHITNQKPGALILNLRELEFLRLAATEMTYKEIADAMGVSARTIDGYRDILFEKLHIKSRVGLVLYGIKNKLITL